MAPVHEISLGFLFLNKEGHNNSSLFNFSFAAEVFYGMPALY